MFKCPFFELKTPIFIKTWHDTCMFKRKNKKEFFMVQTKIKENSPVDPIVANKILFGDYCYHEKRHLLDITPPHIVRNRLPLDSIEKKRMMALDDFRVLCCISYAEDYALFKDFSKELCADSQYPMYINVIDTPVDTLNNDQFSHVIYDMEFENNFSDSLKQYLFNSNMIAFLGPFDESSRVLNPNMDIEGFHYYFRKIDFLHGDFSKKYLFLLFLCTYYSHHYFGKSKEVIFSNHNREVV